MSVLILCSVGLGIVEVSVPVPCSVSLDVLVVTPFLLLVMVDWALLMFEGVLSSQQMLQLPV